MNTSEKVLKLMASGNTLEAQKVLHSGPADSDSITRLNRMVYGAAPQAELAEEQERVLALLPQANDPDHSLMEYNAGCLALAREEILEAKHRFADVVARQPSNRFARHNLAYANELLAEFDTARELYSEAAAQDSSLLLSRLNRALLSLQEGDSSDALAELRALADEQPDNVGLALYLCRALLAQPTPENAEAALEVLEARADWQDFPELQECHAFALYSAGRSDEAEAEFEELTRANPESPFPRLGTIKIMAARGDLKALAQHLKEYDALNPPQSVRAILDQLEGR